MDSAIFDPDFMRSVLQFNPEMLSDFPKNPNFGELFETPEFGDAQSLSFEKDEGTNIGLEVTDWIDLDALSVDQNESCSFGSEVPDFPDNCLKFISDILLEEDLDGNPDITQDYRALQATEKSLYDVLVESYPPSSDCSPESQNQIIESPYSSCSNKSHGSCEPKSHEPQNQNIESPEAPDSCYSNKSHGSCEPNLGPNPLELDPIVNVHVDDSTHSSLELNPQSSRASSGDSEDVQANASVAPNEPSSATLEAEKGEKPGNKLRRRRRKKKSQSEDAQGEERSKKIQVANHSYDDYVEIKQYDDVLLSSEGNDGASFGLNEESAVEVEASGKKLSKKGGVQGKKQSVDSEEVDLRTVLTQCAQAVSCFDLRAANDLLKQIRQHSSPYGDSYQRLAHHAANGLEARIAGTGSTISTNICDMKISSSDFLKAYRLNVQVIPYRRMSFFLANNTIFKLVEKATKIHIIDFGIFLGLQWPCFIQALSKRPNGPPQLRITGIDFPQQGFRPAERVEATGRRLSGYCERFDVPFQYQSIADKWENIKPEDLKIESDEMVIVNCMLRSGTLLDETVEASSPRDGFLRLITNLNPDLFVHGIVNGTFTAPFFINRFKEALFHYSSVFEACDATVPRESHERLLVENELYGKELINVIACEGAERIQRPETYKLWQVRSTRAGLRQVPLGRDIFSKTKAMVRANYHKDFLVDEDRNWMLQGWKGRICYALSFWQPSSKPSS